MHLETRVLVTGGAGFLGSHLCERLLRDGARVICLDNFFTGAHRNSYVDDLVDGLARLMQTGDGVIGPINLGNPDEFSMLQLATTVIELTGSRSRIVHRPKPEDDPKQRRPDISKANQILSWSPKTPLKEGLPRTIAYFEQLLREPAVSRVLAEG